MTPSPHRVRPSTLVLVTGHESDEADFTGAVTDLAAEVVVCSRRVVHQVVRTLLDRTDHVLTVLPMTWGRDPVLVADCAKALQWFRHGTEDDPRVALCASLGTPDHLVAHLRRATREIAASRPQAGVLLVAASDNPFDDAELYRLAHLVRVHGSGAEIEVACLRGDDDLDRGINRCRRLGMDEIVIVPAAFDRTSPGGEQFEGVRFYGPLVSDHMLRTTITDRSHEARHRLDHGDDGIAVGLVADHGHGYAHSHAVEHEGEERAGHDHGHGHGHGHAPAPSFAHGGGVNTSPRITDTKSTTAREPSEV